jgi:hypothetical protein
VTLQQNPDSIKTQSVRTTMSILLRCDKCESTCMLFADTGK